MDHLPAPVALYLQILTCLTLSRWLSMSPEFCILIPVLWSAQARTARAGSIISYFKGKAMASVIINQWGEEGVTHLFLFVVFTKLVVHQGFS